MNRAASIFLMGTIVSATTMLAQQVPADRAKVLDSYGRAQKRVSQTPERWMPIAAGDLLPPDSAVRTFLRSAILLQTADRHTIRVGASTTLELKDVGKDNAYAFQLIAGEIWSFVNKAKKPAKFEVDTPTAVLGVRGTVFHMRFNQSTMESAVSVNEGTVSLSQNGASRNLEGGYEMHVRPGQLAQARPAKHSMGTQRMWKAVLKENWASANATPKLDREADTELVAARQQEREAAREAAQEEKAARQQERGAKAAARGQRGKKP
jgi:hypothetical protein